MTGALSPRYITSNFDKLLRDIEKHSIGLDGWFDRFEHAQDVNYPPYNLVKESDSAYRLELALAGFKRDEVKVYTEHNQLVVEASKNADNDVEYVHRGLASRAFKRAWTLADDVEVREVKFEDGILSVHLSRIIPEKYQKKFWYGDV